MKEYYSNKHCLIYLGDCREVLPHLPLFDNVLTDPPYGLKFMGKDWDHGVPGIDYWKIIMAASKPGAMCMAFGGSRTFHRLCCAIEDAGWEIRDCIMWLYGSGFPKSHEISKAIDKAAGAERKMVERLRTDGKKTGHSASGFIDGVKAVNTERSNVPVTNSARDWTGWGTALKPAYEPICLAMNPLDGTFAAYAQKHGVAGVNVDGARIPTDENPTALRRKAGYAKNTEKAAESEAKGRLKDRTDPSKKAMPNPSHNLGRWPANVIHDGSREVLNEFEKAGAVGQAGPVKGTEPSRPFSNVFSKMGRNTASLPLDAPGNAARFFYCAKADAEERKEGNNWPTVKPIKLMQYLLTLLATPTGGVTVDPFMGSGSTLDAAQRLFRKSVGIDKEESACEIAAKRLEREASPLGI